MEGKRKRKKKNTNNTNNTNKLINGLKFTWLIIRTIFWVVFIILSLFVGLAFLCSDEPYYIDDEEQMREWLQKGENND